VKRAKESSSCTRCSEEVMSELPRRLVFRRALLSANPASFIFEKNE
jgi:hypothetical protein